MATHGRMTRLACAIFAAGLLAPAHIARAQEPGASAEATKSAVGGWELSNAERDRSCSVTLKPPAGGARATIAWEPKCAGLFPFSRDAVAWTIGEMDAIQFVDAKNRTILELTEVEGGLYEGERRGEGIYFLQSAASSAAEEKTPAAFVGEWAFIPANGRALCSVTLDTTPVPPDAFVLKVKPGCTGVVARFAPAAWRLDRGELVVIPANGEVWRFEQIETSVWQRVPSSAEPLRLVKR